MSGSFRSSRFSHRRGRYRSSERLLDLINENDDARRIDACEHGSQETLDVLDPANIVKSLTTPPYREAGRLFDDLALALPKVFGVELAFHQRHRQSLFRREGCQADQGVYRLANHTTLRLRQ